MCWTCFSSITYKYIKFQFQFNQSLLPQNVIHTIYKPPKIDSNEAEITVGKFPTLQWVRLPEHSIVHSISQIMTS